MKFHQIIMGGLALAIGSACLAEEPPLANAKDKLSYAIGASMGKNLRVQSADIDFNLILEGLKAAYAGQTLRMADRDIRIQLGQYQTQLRKTAVETREKAIVENKKAGEAFLAKHKTQPGVSVLPSGVQYSVLKQGDGALPRESDTVVVAYRGALINGTEFDSTLPDQPLTVRVSGLIPGWKDALKAMPVGSKWNIVIPSDLGYGERGLGDIGPNEVLVFDLELVAIK